MLTLTEVLSEIISENGTAKTVDLKNCLNVWANSGAILSKQGLSGDLGLRVQRQIIAEVLGEALRVIFNERKAQADLLEALLFELKWPLHAFPIDKAESPVKVNINRLPLVWK